VECTPDEKNMAVAILVLGLVFFLSHLFTVVFDRTRIPDVLLLILVGMLFGPLLGIVAVEDFGKIGSVLSTLALIVILFESGTQLSYETLRKSLKPTLGLTIITFLVTLTTVAAFSFLLIGLSPMGSLIVGAILGGTSSAVVIPLARGLKMSQKPETILVLESAVTDVLCIVFTIGFIGAELSGNIEPVKMTGYILSTFLFAALIGLGGSLAWSAIQHFVRRFPNTYFSTLAFVFIIYGITGLLGFSGGIAALAFGFGLANNRKIVALLRIDRIFKRDFSVISTIEKTFFGEIVFILKTFFFLFLGISIRFSGVEATMIALLMVILVFVFRLFISRFTLSRDIPAREVSYISVMVPKGLAAAVLAGIPLRDGVEGGALIQDIVFIVVLFSITLTAILIPLIGKGWLDGFYLRFFRTFGKNTK
jgi:NhaP-type Na+/H+ or K+/H+ antiporter